MTAMQPDASHAASDALTWLHIGDLHITDPDLPSHRDLTAITEQAGRHLAGGVDFAVLPGDNADNGTAAQYRLVRAAIDRLHMPVHILPGDHDFQPGNLTAMRDVLGAAPLRRAVTAAQCRCLFLDVVSAGSGGPDFRLGAAQLQWLTRELDAATAAGQTPVVFMHTYPADLRDAAAEVTSLFARHRVAFVDMGHTHYNELANDGRTIYAATRSTGQIEEGPAGFAIAAIDRGAVSWRFKPLARAWPFLLITAPVDRRLVTDTANPAQVPRGAFELRARAWSAAGITEATCRIDAGPRQLITAAGGPLWTARCTAPGGGFSLEVQVRDAEGGADAETIAVAGADYAPPPRRADGSDADAIGAWPEQGLPGGQLGPNRNGRKW